MIKINYIKSPINYSGSKYRLIKKGLMLYFPENINTFVDLFCGACNVGINSDAENIICNDYINYLPELFNCWKHKTKEEINEYIDDTISEYGLSSASLDNFLEFRRHYNETKNVEDLFVLICYSFNYQMRFNNSHIYNSSFGYEASSMNGNIRKNLDTFIDVIQKKDIKFTNKDFRKLKLEKLHKDDFVYLDPPYLISGAIYQDGKRGFKGWSQGDDLDLYELCDKLNANGIKFAMSNMFESKGNTNQTLIDWAKKYNTNYLTMNYSSSNYQRASNVENKDVEVLITNY